MKNLIAVILIILILASCRKNSDVSIIPSITYKSLITYKYSDGKDSTGRLTFEYVDGDGDLGSDDSTAPQNLFVKFLEKKNGVFTEPALPIGFNVRIPSLTPKSRNKSISGEITYNLFLPPHVVNDTVKFQIYIVDRAGNKSNTIETGEISVTTQ